MNITLWSKQSKIENILLYWVLKIAVCSYTWSSDLNQGGEVPGVSPDPLKGAIKYVEINR